MAVTTYKDLHLDSFLPYVMSNLADSISLELSTIYRQQYDLTTSQWRVLANLAQHGTLTAKEIVSFTGMDKTKTSRTVNALDKRGLLNQILAEDDNRSKDLSLTKAGTELYQSMVPRVLHWEGQLLNCLGRDEYRNLMSTLEKLKLQLAGTTEDSLPRFSAQ